MMLRGVPMALHPAGEGVSDGIRRSGDFYEAQILDYIAEHHRNQRTIVDAGAMIGNHSAYFAAFLQYDEIHSFEPIEANRTLLEQNVAPFRGVTVHALGLSSCEQTLQMATNPANMGACLVTMDGTLQILAVALDACGLRDISLLKIDVENHEPDLLRGARQSIQRDHPLILIEDWSYGGHARLLPGYGLERAWPESFTYLYRWPA